MWRCQSLKMSVCSRCLNSCCWRQFLAHTSRVSSVVINMQTTQKTSYIFNQQMKSVTEKAKPLRPHWASPCPTGGGGATQTPTHQCQWGRRDCGSLHLQHPVCGAAVEVESGSCLIYGSFLRLNGTIAPLSLQAPGDSSWTNLRFDDGREEGLAFQCFMMWKRLDFSQKWGPLKDV